MGLTATEPSFGASATRDTNREFKRPFTPAPFGREGFLYLVDPNVDTFVQTSTRQDGQPHGWLQVMCLFEGLMIP